MPITAEIKKSPPATGTRGFSGRGENIPATLFDLFKGQLPPDRPFTLSGFPNEADWIRRGGLNRPPKRGDRRIYLLFST